jgi:hypothetical protein
MTRRRKHRSHWTDSLPDDEWTHEPKVHLYRLEHPRKPCYLATYLAFLVDESYVAATHGGGEYLFILVYRGRTLRRGIWAIEGNPIRHSWANNLRRG